MSKIHEKLRGMGEESTWYLRRPGGNIDGPMMLAALRETLSQTANTQGWSVSINARSWISVKEIPDLMSNSPSAKDSGQLEFDIGLPPAPAPAANSVAAPGKPENNTEPQQSAGTPTGPARLRTEAKSGAQLTEENRHKLEKERELRLQIEKTTSQREHEMEKTIARMRQELASSGNIVQSMQTKLDMQIKEYDTLKKQSAQREADLNRRVQDLENEIAGTAGAINQLKSHLKTEQLARTEAERVILQGRTKDTDSIRVSPQLSHDGATAQPQLHENPMERIGESQASLNKQLSDAAALRRMTRVGPSPVALITMVVIVVAACFFIVRMVRKPKGTSADHARSPSAGKQLEPEVPAAPAVLPRKPQPAFSPGVSAQSAGSARPTVAVSDFRMDGITASPKGEQYVIVFADTLFASRAQLSVEAKAILSRLAPVLRKYLPEFSLVIEGHTDSSAMKGGEFADNKALGMARAKAVQAFLASDCKLPAEPISVTSVGDADPPYSNSTPDGRRKNRTVVLKLEPVQRPRLQP